MREKDLENLLLWADQNKKDDFKHFVLNIKDRYEKKDSIIISYKGKKEQGNIFYWLILFNVRFPDFDMTLCINDEKSGVVLSFLTMDSFKKETDSRYCITDVQGENLIVEW